MVDTLQDFGREALIAAIEQNYIDFTCAYVQSAHKQVHEDAQLTWVMTGTPLEFFNAVLRATLANEEADAAIDAVVSSFQGRQQLMTWWVMPSSRPADLAQRLLARGLRYEWQDIGMAIDLQAINEDFMVPAGLTVETVRDEAGMQRWLTAFQRGFELDDQVLADYRDLVMSVPIAHHPVGPFYVGLLDGEPVATSALYCSAGVAGICEVCTAPAARRKGVGMAVTAVALREGRARGYRVGVLDASEMGTSMYQRLGFREYCRLDVYGWKP